MSAPPVSGGARTSPLSKPSTPAAPAAAAAAPSEPAAEPPAAGQSKARPDTFVAPKAAKPAELAPETAVNLFKPGQAAALARATSQVTEVSVMAGNQNEICGGAAVVNALVLGSTTAQTAAANAKALGTLADSTGAYSALPPNVKQEDVKAALGRLGTGKASQDDLAQLQQLAFAVGTRVDNQRKDAMTPHMMSGVLRGLADNGAVFPPGARFVGVNGANTEGHWVVATRDQATGKDNVFNSSRDIQVTPDMLRPSSSHWMAEITPATLDTPVKASMRNLETAGDQRKDGKPYSYEVAREPPAPFAKVVDTLRNEVRQGIAQARARP